MEAQTTDVVVDGVTATAQASASLRIAQVSTTAQWGSMGVMFGAAHKPDAAVASAPAERLGGSAITVADAVAKSQAMPKGGAGADSGGASRSASVDL